MKKRYMVDCLANHSVEPFQKYFPIFSKAERFLNEGLDNKTIDVGNIKEQVYLISSDGSIDIIKERTYDFQDSNGIWVVYDWG